MAAGGTVLYDDAGSDCAIRFAVPAGGACKGHGGSGPRYRTVTQGTPMVFVTVSRYTLSSATTSTAEYLLTILETVMLLAQSTY